MMNLDEKIEKYKKTKNNQVDKIYECVKKVVKNDPNYYKDKDYAKSFLNKTE